MLPKKILPQKKWQRALVLGSTLLIGAALGVFTLGFFAASMIYDYEDSIRNEPYPAINAIVCLSGGKGRIQAASNFWFQFYIKRKLGGGLEAEEGEVSQIPVLYLAGMGPKANWDVFSRQVDSEVLQVLRKEDVIIENQSENTRENAEIFRLYARERNWARIVLMTSSYHMKRSKFLFERAFESEFARKIKIETKTVELEPFTAKNWSTDLYSIRVTLIEFFKWTYYRTNI